MCSICVASFFQFEEARNNLEKLTLAVLTHLPTAVVYVHDLTGECGTSVSDQVNCFSLRSDLQIYDLL